MSGNMAGFRQNPVPRRITPALNIPLLASIFSAPLQHEAL
ncbi:hypothetical protein G3564_0935 (plasmid) [Salmonella enterica subsp. enterica serovar Agona]|uniref:Uncharacterized protein n=2 Tax=Enterobacteriaceae TaxID=543 RepID=A0A7G9A9G8_ECOLX|nr:hypothetical protein CSB67_5272 [Enterobacter hormaechei]QIV62507.1 hypothetical protein G3564_0935 [Salmonella enterica subsp. enterica serovar Agona]QNL33397.1 hypothetical protein [Escherichia coli]UKU09190.1 hypothetical protein [Salmonella sp.]UMW89396.1 hypothetical protein [Klebsiella pneumoniae]